MGNTVTSIQREANRQNAQYSTGPVTDEGKQTVAQNALKHGLFARTLILQDEDPAEYQNLLDEMIRALRPVGALEQALVERLTVTLWRQRRLVRAETAAIDMARQDQDLAEAVSYVLGIERHSPLAVTVDEFTAPEPADIDRYEHVLEEYGALEAADFTDLQCLQHKAPTLYRELTESAEEEGLSADALLGEYDAPQDYFAWLAEFCRHEIRVARRRPLVRAVAQRVRDRRAVPEAGLMERLTKYQAQLDNALHKTLKALREAQQWRLQTLEAIETPSTP